MKKKLSARILATALSLCAISSVSIGVSAQANNFDNDAYIYFPDVTTSVGETITIPIQVKNFDGFMSSYGIPIDYDPEYLELETITFDSCVNNLCNNKYSRVMDDNSFARLYVAGYIASRYDSSNLPTGSYTVAYATFNVLKAGETNLELYTASEHVEVDDLFGETIPTKNFSNVITIKGDVTPSATLKKISQRSSNAIGECITIKNSGSLPVDMKKVEVRYYFSSDDVEGAYYSTALASAKLSNGGRFTREYLNGKVVKMDNPTDTADSYVSITYSAYDKLVSADDYVEVVFFIMAPTMKTTYDPTNDYSYINDSVAVFYDGEYVSGSIPQ